MRAAALRTIKTDNRRRDQGPEPVDGEHPRRAEETSTHACSFGLLGHLGASQTDLVSDEADRVVREPGQ